MSAHHGVTFRKSLTRRRRALVDGAFLWLCRAVSTLSLVILVVLLFSMVREGIGHLDWAFLTGLSSHRPEEAGFYPAIMGSLWLCIVTAVSGLPLGVGAAIYLHEFAPRSRLTTFIQVNISNLAGVPSVVYGLIGLAAFVSFGGIFGGDVYGIGLPGTPLYLEIPFGRSVLAGGLTLMLVVLPIVIVASQEALRAVPDSLREGALALGATRWQMVKRMTLPSAMPGILTGAILAMSRAIGETAPILVVGGALLAPPPQSLASNFMAMPIQIFHWTGHTNLEFQQVAAAGIIVLLAVLLLLNGTAIFLRARFRKRLSA